MKIRVTIFKLWVFMFSFLKQMVTQVSGKLAKKPIPQPASQPKEVIKVVTDKLPDGRPYLITRKELLMGRDSEYPLTPQFEANLAHTLEVLNKLRYAYGKPMSVTSGYRPGKYNVAAGGAKASAHLSCEACDFADADGSLDKWCQANKPLLISLGLRLESPAHTKGWCHLDTRYRSGDPEFIP